MAQLPLETKNRISHRARALEKMRPHLLSYDITGSRTSQKGIRANPRLIGSIPLSPASILKLPLPNRLW